MISFPILPSKWLASDPSSHGRPIVKLWGICCFVVKVTLSYWGQLHINAGLLKPCQPGFQVILLRGYAQSSDIELLTFSLEHQSPSCHHMFRKPMLLDLPIMTHPFLMLLHPKTTGIPSAGLHPDNTEASLQGTAYGAEMDSQAPASP